MKRIVPVVLALLLTGTACQFMSSYMTNDLIPPSVDPITSAVELSEVQVTEEATGACVTLSGGETEPLLLQLRNIECTRSKVTGEEQVKFRIRFVTVSRTYDDFLLLSDSSFCSGGYRYLSLTGSFDLLYFEQLFR